MQEDPATQNLAIQTPTTTINHTTTRTSTIPSAGHGLFTTKAFGEGEAVLVLPRALLYVLDRALEKDVCGECFHDGPVRNIVQAGTSRGEDGKGGELCERCKDVWYCSQECRIEGRKRGHGIECEGRAQGSRGRDWVDQAVERLAAMKEEGVLDERVIQAFGEDDGGLEGDEWKRRLPGRVSSPFALRMKVGRAKVRRRALDFKTPTGDKLGMVLDPVLGMINHSCEPNAYIVFDGPQVSLRTYVPVAKDAELFTSYTDPSYPFAWRQALLKVAYSFDCNCPKCKQGPSGPEDAFLHPITNAPSSLETLNFHPATPSPNLPEHTTYIGPSDHETNRSHTIRQSHTLLEKSRGSLRQHEPASALEYAELGIQSLAGTQMIPPTRQPYPDLRLSKLQALIQLDMHADALAQAAYIHFFIDPVLYPHVFAPQRVVHTFQLVRILLQKPRSWHPAGFDLISIAWGLLEQVNGQVKMSHGKTSGLSEKVGRLRDETERNVLPMLGITAEALMERFEQQWEAFRWFAETVE